MKSIKLYLNIKKPAISQNSINLVNDTQYFKCKLHFFHTKRDDNMKNNNKFNLCISSERFDLYFTNP